MARIHVVLSLVILALTVDLGLTQTITVNGAWSPWSIQETACVRVNETTKDTKPVSCGGGVKIKFRSCTNPAPQGLRAKYCPGDAELQFPCNLHPCDISWSEWAECTGVCARGTRRAVSECSKDPGGPKELCSRHFPDHDFEHIENCNTWNKTTCPR